MPATAQTTRKPTKSVAMAATRRVEPAPVAPARKARKVRVVTDYCERVRLRDRFIAANRHLSSPSQATREWAQREVAMAKAALGWTF